MHAHGVDAVLGEAGGGEVGRLLVRGAGGVGEVDAPELDGRAVLEGEAVLDHADAAVLARGLVEPAVHVDDARHQLLAGRKANQSGPASVWRELVEVGLRGVEGHVVGEGQRQGHAALALGEQVGRQHHAHAVVEGDGAWRVELHRDRAALVEGEARPAHVAGAARTPRTGSASLVCLPSAWVRVSVPLLPCRPRS